MFTHVWVSIIWVIMIPTFRFLRLCWNCVIEFQFFHSSSDGNSIYHRLIVMCQYPFWLSFSFRNNTFGICSISTQGVHLRIIRQIKTFLNLILNSFYISLLQLRRTILFIGDTMTICLCDRSWMGRHHLCVVHYKKARHLYL